jgi:hypothetical protein
VTKDIKKEPASKPRRPRKPPNSALGWAAMLAKAKANRLAHWATETACRARVTNAVETALKEGWAGEENRTYKLPIDRDRKKTERISNTQKSRIETLIRELQMYELAFGQLQVPDVVAFLSNYETNAGPNSEGIFATCAKLAVECHAFGDQVIARSVSAFKRARTDNTRLEKRHGTRIEKITVDVEAWARAQNVPPEVLKLWDQVCGQDIWVEKIPPG